MKSLATPRAPRAPIDVGLYESHYVTATDPAGGRALWLRHTALKRPGQVAHPTVWLVWFDQSAPGPRAVRVTGRDPLADPGAAWARSPLGEISSEGARGAIDGAAWALTWQGHAPEVPYLPARWMYDRRLPRSGGVALVPSATVSGKLTLDGGESVDLDGWDAMVGHNWGSEHADQWTWVHAGGLGDDRSGWLDLALARVKVGPVLTPWLAAGVVHLGGQSRAPARRGRVRREVDGQSTLLTVPLGGDATLELSINAPDRRTVRWDYASPAGLGRDVRNCSIADGRVRLTVKSGELSYEVQGRLAVEHGMPGA
jgi:hypothetical protein